MRRLFILSVLICLSAFSFNFLAQETTPEPLSGLVPQDVEITAEIDAFGRVARIAEGTIVNFDSVAYENINIFADVYDETGELIGEGFGSVVNACGTGLLPDFALQPQSRQAFRLNIELFNFGLTADRVEIFPEGTPIEPLPIELPQRIEGIQSVVRAEVVNVEWVNASSLRFAIGCDADVFTNQAWFDYNITENTRTRIIHPNTQSVTPELLETIGLAEPVAYKRSYLTFAPTSDRIIYQSPINVVLTAEENGTSQRLIYDDLARRSLHGFIWLPEGRFLAYYYGAYGEEVTYFTASLEGQLISGSIYEVTPSMTVPGPTPDGARAVITMTVDGVSGYYLKQTRFVDNELLFETTDIPGNNYPAPIYAQAPTGDAFIYIVRPVEGTPTLQCFDMQTRGLNTLTELPVDITTDDRAWTWLSPDGNQIALAANGINGGLWLIDLLAFGGCSGIT